MGQGHTSSLELYRSSGVAGRFGSSLLRNPELEDAFFFWIFGHLLKFLFLIIVVEFILEAE